MYFKRLEVIGFKSFAERTLVHFEPGVTAIVGPNGCGKSNVADAIRWVLGEQSAKSLRGSSMEDVIFNGTAAKEAVNFAEVSLTLSNESKFLAIDYDEVTVTRRLYRSGESEYLLNQNTVRLRDIHELFMGTGIGAESYAIIEQGRMDQVLNAKPDERRAIFEEAAGITKFKSKKKEALRKLEQTEQNLLRVNDIIVEVKRQIGSIERQARKAESYKIEFEKLKKLEIALASREFLTFETRRREKEENLGRMRREEEECADRMAEMEERCREARARVDEADRALQECRAGELDAASGIKRDQDRILLNRERVGELAERKNQLSRQIEQSEVRAAELKRENETFNAEFEAIRREETEGGQLVAAAESAFVAAEAAALEAVRLAEEANRALFEIAARRANLQTELAKARTEVSHLAAQSGRSKERQAAFEAESAELEALAAGPVAAGDRSFAGSLGPLVESFRSRIEAFFKTLFERGATSVDDGARGQLEGEIRAFAGDVAKAQGSMTDDRVRLRENETRRRRIADEIGVLESEIRGFAAEWEHASARERDAEAALASLAAEESALQARIRESEEANRGRSAEKDSLLVRLSESRSRQGHAAARREQLERDRHRLAETVASEESQIDLLLKEIESSERRREALEAESAELESQVSELSIRRDELLRRGEEVRRERTEAAAAFESLEREREDRRSFLGSAKERVHADEMADAELRHAMDRLKERIFNSYQFDLALRGEAEAMEAGAAELLGGPVDPQAVQAEIQALRDKLAKMGPVNLVAIDEFDEMRTRYDFLTKQQADLNQAKDDLHQAILKINRTTRELFSETFEKIQVHFSEYYRLLFGGGQANLVLLDESDVLESGIEIVARPPGKKLQSISLLSGGEKALTAVALLFSLFKVRPSPFCVLDEIDAPLDETNVDRFCNVLREFVVGSQFILITHNKRTMHLADALYGITMAENGVSKIVSVKFADGKKRPAVPAGRARQKADGQARAAVTEAVTDAEVTE